MATKVLTREEIYQLFITELQNQDSTLTDDTEGSLIDVLAGVVSTVAAQISRLTVSEYARTFFESADGPEITGGVDNLETLAVDHFGSQFARPPASKATGTVTFSRATADYGAFTIPAGSEVATDTNANGVKQTFVTSAAAEVGAAATSIDVEVEAAVAGTAGNVSSATVTNIVSTLEDSSLTVTNASAMAGGSDTETDAEYRQTISQLLQSLKGATLAALQSKALAVSGVAYATAIEVNTPVIEYDIAGEDIAAGATYFRIPYAYIYIADVNGNSTDSLVASVQTDIDLVRAAGVKVQVLGASAVSLNWTAGITLDAGGPNFATLSSDPALIEASMEEYIKGLPIGTDFDRTIADAAILAIWGSAGTGDLTAFTTSLPVGNVDVADTEKLIPGTVEVS